ncbi:MAG: hypothetical protein HC828_19515 [Blastochloris sp.]|nr:hypothetical protein [Blastochloris sp.]
MNTTRRPHTDERRGSFSAMKSLDIQPTTWRARIRLVFTLGIGAYGLALLVIGAFLLIPLDHSLVEFGRSFYLFTLIPAPLALIVALLLGRRGLAGLFVPLTVAALAYYVPYLLPKASAAADERTLTVVTFNFLRWNSGATALEAMIRAADADIVALQQVSDITEAYLRHNLANMYPYMGLHDKEGRWTFFRGMGVLSRYPITSDEYWVFPAIESHGQQRVEIDMDGQPIVVYNVHTWRSVDWQGNIRVRVLEADERAHVESSRRLYERAAAEMLPTLIVGDFNMTDQFTEYGLFAGRFTDSFRAAGQGMGFTYPARAQSQTLPPIMRIDYIFHSDHFVRSTRACCPIRA